jgi:hypothetical protein
MVLFSSISSFGVEDCRRQLRRNSSPVFSSFSLLSPSILLSILVLLFFSSSPLSFSPSSSSFVEGAALWETLGSCVSLGFAYSPNAVTASTTRVGDMNGDGEDDLVFILFRAGQCGLVRSLLVLVLCIFVLPCSFSYLLFLLFLQWLYLNGGEGRTWTKVGAVSSPTFALQVGECSDPSIYSTIMLAGKNTSSSSSCCAKFPASVSVPLPDPVLVACFFVDFDGDSRADIALRRAPGLSFFEYRKCLFSLLSLSTHAHFLPSYSLLFLPLSLILSHTITLTPLIIYLSFLEGGSILLEHTTLQLSSANGWNVVSHYATIKPFDLNGDSCMDIG